MGFWSKTPPPPSEPNPNMGTVSPKHQHTWYDQDGRKHNDTCYCDTGRNHATPKDT